jgi:hypothetical protein
MRSSRIAHERLDTWDEGWEARLTRYVQGAGCADVWDYVQRRPGVSYTALADELSTAGGFGVVGIQVERLQVRDTPEADQARSIRDSLVRHLHAALAGVGWRNGAYWESRALGALAAWSAMWVLRADVAPLKRRMFEIGAPSGWLPRDADDRFLLSLVPEPRQKS